MSIGFPLRPRRVAGAAVILAVLSVGAQAAAPSSPEVNYLVDFVRSSSCTFIRNGDAHTSADAAEHIAMKANYIGGSKIRNGDDLIEMAGSKSSMSGKPYFVQCPGHEQITASAWLHGELNRYRAAQGATATARP